MDEFLPIKSFRVKNFKGIRDSGEVRFTPLTVFIGNNGSGKSSLIEALQTYRHIVNSGLDRAMHIWRGFENIHNPPISLMDNNGDSPISESIDFVIEGELETFAYEIKMLVQLTQQNSNNRKIGISEEVISLNKKVFLKRDETGKLYFGDKYMTTPLQTSTSILAPPSGILLIAGATNQPLNTRYVTNIMQFILNWKFLTLNPDEMINPLRLQETSSTIRLESNGSNIAEYLMDIRKQSQDAYDGIIEALTYVLPYLKDMQPNITTELERTVYLRMHEGDFTVPQWLLSTGTMRILCLLALFRHPTPPPVIFIEEIENGLDPHTIQYIIEEIRSLIVTGKSQVVITTHSPYLLDLLDLSQIVVVEREGSETTFHRPADDESLQAWSKKFSPGQLYTMNRLAHQEG
ncbi:MAG: ATP-binding protein [bacterium]|nr:ATP-binding protein [bacterium]